MLKVAEKTDGKWWGKGSSSSTVKSGSRTKMEDRAAGGVADSKVAIR